MAWLVNETVVPLELIQEEEAKLRNRPDWREISGRPAFAIQIREAAEKVAIDRVLFWQATTANTDSLNQDAIDRELEVTLRLSGFLPSPEQVIAKKAIEERHRADKTVAALLGEPFLPSEADFRKFYSQNRRNFLGQPMFRAAHVVVHVNDERSDADALAKITEALAELRRGVRFQDVVAKYSDCKENDGNLGEFSAGVMVEEFESALRNLKPGERSSIFRTPFGYHIAELRSMRPPAPLKYAECRDDIERVMTFMARQQSLERALIILRSKARIRRVSKVETAGIADASSVR